MTAYERADKNNVVWLRWNRPGTGLYDKMSLSKALRDEQGRLIEELVREVQRTAQQAYDQLLRGESPRDPVRPVDERGELQLTVAKGLELALAVPNGMYSSENEHVRDMRRYATHLLRVLPSSLTWDVITEITYEECWRSLAALKRDEGIGGKRSAELAVVLLAQAGRWLRRKRLLRDRPDTPGDGWKKKLADDWRNVTGQAPAPARPRYSPAELGRLHLHVDDVEADARIRLAFRLAGEARLGQAVKLCTREHLELGKVCTTTPDA